MAELIRCLLEEKGEVEGDAQSRDGQDAVPSAADGGAKEMGRLSANMMPVSTTGPKKARSLW